MAAKRKSASPQLKSLFLLLHSLALHALTETLLVATILASIPLAHINETVAICAAGVDDILANGALEETLAAFAGEDAIVFACSAISAN